MLLWRKEVSLGTGVGRGGLPVEVTPCVGSAGTGERL